MDAQLTKLKDALCSVPEGETYETALYYREKS
jgi:hypothetical protein